MKNPIILAEPRTDGVPGWEYFCKFCHRVHIYGLPLGSRGSHCINKESPNYMNEIVLVRKDER